jgi:tRNA G46 methylase TrmB
MPKTEILTMSVLTKSNQDNSVGNSHQITTNQTGIHEKLDDIVKRHLTHRFQKPVQVHTQQAFDDINKVVEAFDGDIILDACCGVGQSTRILAKNNPNALVIGVDKSAHRINRNVDEHSGDQFVGVENYYLIRADLNDFFRLVADAKWPVKKHYILYPNPWPKSKHLQRRWHGSAVFPNILNIGDELILRSNWLLYLEEFSHAAALTGISGQLSDVNKSEPSLTPFEEKYQLSGQQCYQLIFKRDTFIQ